MNRSRIYAGISPSATPPFYHLLIEIDPAVCDDDPVGFLENRAGLPPDRIWRGQRGWGGESGSMSPLWLSVEPRLLDFESGYLEDEPHRIHYYYGDDREEGAPFGAMANRALQCLDALPRAVPGSFPDLDRYLPHPNVRKNPADYWMLLVHRLAWHQHPRSPLRAKREVWATRTKGWPGFSLPYDLDDIKRFFETQPTLARGFVGGFPPKYRCSVFPTNVFQCSAWAIDLLLEEIGRQSITAGGRSPGQEIAKDQVREEGYWIICSQADVALKMGKSPHTTGFLQMLKQQDRIDYEKIDESNVKSKYRVHFHDGQEHERMRTLLAPKPKKRSTPKPKNRRIS